MRIRKGAPWLIALLATVAASQTASAHLPGAKRFACGDNCGDASSSFANQAQTRVAYKLVYDTVMEKRWHTVYKTVSETVNTQVTKTVYKEESSTQYRPCYRT